MPFMPSFYKQPPRSTVAERHLEKISKPKESCIPNVFHQQRPYAHISNIQGSNGSNNFLHRVRKESGDGMDSIIGNTCLFSHSICREPTLSFDSIFMKRKSNHSVVAGVCGGYLHFTDSCSQRTLQHISKDVSEYSARLLSKYRDKNDLVESLPSVSKAIAHLIDSRLSDQRADVSVAAIRTFFTGESIQIVGFSIGDSSAGIIENRSMKSLFSSENEVKVEGIKETVCFVNIEVSAQSLLYLTTDRMHHFLANEEMNIEFNRGQSLTSETVVDCVYDALHGVIDKLSNLYTNLQGRKQEQHMRRAMALVTHGESIDINDLFTQEDADFLKAVDDPRMHNITFSVFPAVEST